MIIHYFRTIFNINSIIYNMYTYILCILTLKCKVIYGYIYIYSIYICNMDQYLGPLGENSGISLQNRQFFGFWSHLFPILDDFKVATGDHIEVVCLDGSLLYHLFTRLHLQSPGIACNLLQVRTGETFHQWSQLLVRHQGFPVAIRHNTLYRTHLSSKTQVELGMKHHETSNIRNTYRATRMNETNPSFLMRSASCADFCFKLALTAVGSESMDNTAMRRFQLFRPKAKNFERLRTFNDMSEKATTDSRQISSSSKAFSPKWDPLAYSETWKLGTGRLAGTCFAENWTHCSPAWGQL